MAGFICHRSFTQLARQMWKHDICTTAEQWCHWYAVPVTLAILTDVQNIWSWLHFELFSYIRLDYVPIMQRKSVFMLEYLAQNKSSPNLKEDKTHFLYMSPILLSLWWLRKKKALKNNVNPLKKYSLSYLRFISSLKYFGPGDTEDIICLKCIWSSLTCFWGHLSQPKHKQKSRERQRGNARWSFAISSSLMV